MRLNRIGFIVSLNTAAKRYRQVKRGGKQDEKRQAKQRDEATGTHKKTKRHIIRQNGKQNEKQNTQIAASDTKRNKRYGYTSKHASKTNNRMIRKVSKQGNTSKRKSPRLLM